MVQQRGCLSLASFPGNVAKLALFSNYSATLFFYCPVLFCRNLISYFSRFFSINSLICSNLLVKLPTFRHFGQILEYIRMPKFRQP